MVYTVTLEGRNSTGIHGN